MGRKTILVVDDNLDTRFVLQAILNYDGYVVLEAENGARGFEIAIRELPDFIIMDLLMPVLGGIAAAEQLRADRRTRLIPMISISGQDFTFKEETQIQMLFNESYKKPFSALTILNAVRKSIGPPGQVGPDGELG